jgi:hypothetical protein
MNENPAARTVTEPPKDRDQARKDSPQHHKQGEVRIEGFKPEFYQQLVTRAGWPVKRKRRIDIDLACKMLDAGWSFNQVGRLWGVCGQTVKNRLRESGRY